MMEKSNLQAIADSKPDSVVVLPRTLGIRPMEYNKDGKVIFFSGVFGDDPQSKAKLDVWVATFFDRNEAEMFVMASKAFGNPTLGVRLALAKPEDSGARISGSPEAPVGG